MHELVKKIIDTHGGTARWNQVKKISAKFQPGGLNFKLRQQEEFTKMPTYVTVDVKKCETTFEPFIEVRHKAIYDPDKVTILTDNGAIVAEATNPRSSFESLAPNDAWTQIQLGYFAGYAMHYYFVLPFCLAMPGFEFEETEPYIEGSETWRTLKVTFPESFVTHSKSQTLYIDDFGLIRRIDYSVDISNGALGAHYLYDHEEFDGIVFPTRRVIYKRGSDLKPAKDIIVFSAGLTDYKLS